MRLFTLCFLLITAFGVSAQDKAGITFQEKSFDALLADAKAQDKLIFIDAFTTWCGPCKMMSANVFPQEEVGKVYNERFINAKIDMEMGEGPALAKRYNVNAYPTYLFVDGDGNIVHKGLGYIVAEKFLALADVAISDDNLFAYNERYAKGERDAEFMAAYAEMLTSVNERESAKEVVNTYLSSLDKEEWKQENAMNLIINNPGELGGERFNYILENADAFKKSASSAQVIGTLQSIIFKEYNKVNRSREMPAIADMSAYYTEHTATLAPQLTAHYSMLYAENNRQDNYADLAVKYYNMYPSNDAMELNGVAWNFFESVDDPNHLKSALGWAMESVRLDKQYMNMDTLAWLYNKMGMKAQAKKTATEAIELAKAEGSDYSETSPILEEE